MSQAMFEAFFKNLPFPCCITQLERVIACNQAMLELTEQTVETTIGCVLPDLLEGSLPSTWWQSTEPTIITFKECVYLASWTPVDENRQMLILQDQQVQVEREQRKNDMLNTASHDLKSGLSALTGFLELIANLG